MKVDDIMKSRGPQLVPLSADSRDLPPVRERLLAAGFTLEAMGVRLGSLWSTFHELPGYVWRMERDDSPLARLVLLFLLSRPVARPEIDAALGAEIVQALLLREVLQEQADGRLLSRVDLHECLGTLLFTDHNVGVMRFRRHVYEPGGDSYICARATPRRPVRRALDLCTGAGLHALVAARHADDVTGVDINPRALSFARVNASLNGVFGHTRFVEGDLYDALAPDEAPFDLIVSNPPWIATPDDSIQLYRWGGETGEHLTRKIVEGLPRWLASGGCLSMFVVYPLMRDTSYLERLQAWLGGGRGWGVSVLTLDSVSLESFINAHMTGKWTWDDHVAEFGRWMEAYDRHGIARMGTAMVYVTRAPEGHPGWAVERAVNIPLRDVSARVTRWLEAVERAHAPSGDATPSSSLSPDVERVWVDAQSGEAIVTFAETWAPALRLDRFLCEALERLRGGDAVGPAETAALAARGLIG